MNSLDIIYCDICGKPISKKNLRNHRKCFKRRRRLNKHHIRRPYSQRDRRWNKK